MLGQILKKATGGVLKVELSTGDILPIARTVFGTIGFGVSLWAGGDGLACDEYVCTHPSSVLPYDDDGKSCGAK